MESAAVNAARWVVGKALSPLSGGFVEAWAASTELGPNIGAIKTELLYAQGMLHNARGRETSNLALQQLLLQLRGLAYDAEDVLDELDYFRIQDELDGTYEAAEEHAKGCLYGLVLNTRHTVRNIKKKACSCGDNGEASRHANDGEALAGSSCIHKLFSNARERSRFLCCTYPRKASHIGHTVKTPKLKFDRVDLSTRMKHIVEQLKSVCAKVSTILNLELLESNRTIGLMSLNAALSRMPGQAPLLPSSIAMSRPVTTSEFIDLEFYGRMSERSKITNDITQGDYCGKDLTIIPIVGSGGIGKTTLTQNIYREVQNHFDVKVWVCVSLNFNVYRLKEEIAKLIPGLKDEKPGGPDDLIEQRLKSKRFLLVLDDMWNCGNEDEWKRLLAPLRKAQSTGNIILVTTRFLAVAEMVKTIDHSIQLEGLESDVFWELFQACVFGDEKSIDNHADLLVTGKKIAEKLKGSPLAAKTVGRLLRNHLNLEHWTSVLESKEWELQTGENDIMPALKLSYDYLPFHLQHCFTYCALFPEDYRFESDEVIHLWIGLDILQSQNQNKKVEDIGLSYLNDLVNYGFFRKDMNKDGSPYYTMHDLLHELALNVSTYEHLAISSSNVRTVQIPPSIRHLSIVIDVVDVNDRVTFENVKKDFSTLHKRLDVEKLHSLMIFGQYHGSFVIPFGDLFSKAKALRVILMSTASYAMENMLQNFSKLVHLRYLRIVKGYFQELSISNIISRFYQLRILDVRECSGHFNLPSEMSNLVKLRHFLVRDDSLHSAIANVGKLKCLQELRRFEVKGQAEAFALRQIGQLEVLKRSLGIYNLENAQTGEEANLLNKRHLHKLVLVWSNDSSRAEHVLENLKPHDNLQELHIKGHGGTTCPSWLGVNLSTKNLQSLCLDGIQWNKFPPLGELWLVNACGEESLSCTTSQSFQKLKRLELVGIPRLAKWAGIDASHVFSLLEVFIVRDCPELMELPFSHSTCPRSGPEMNLTQFPTLRELEIVNCPKLSSFPHIPWTSSPCRVLIDEVGSDFQRLDYSKNDQSEFCLVVEGKDGHLDMSFWNVLAFSNLTELKYLYLKKCPPLPLKHLLVLSCLRSLTIHVSSNVLLNVEAENTVGYQFQIEDLSIDDCSCSGKELTLLLSLFPKLSGLSLVRCGNIRGLGVAKEQMMAISASSSSPSGHKLEDARVGQEQEQLRGEDEKAAADSGLLLLPHQLQELFISNISELILQFDSLVDGTAGGLRGIGGGLQGLHSLRTLTVGDCPNFLSSYYSSSSSSCFPFPPSLQNLFFDGVGGMETLAPLSNLSSLTRLIIEGCMDLSGEGLSSLLAHGKLTDLRIRKTPKFFVGCGSDPLQLQCLETDDITKVLAAPICSLLASSLTSLTIRSNNEVERFTKEQSAALLLLSSLQDLEFRCCSELQSLPTGLHRLTSLKRLKIWFCPAIRSLPKGGLPSSLEVLDVRYSDNEELKRQCRKLRGTIPIIKDRYYY
ncbi:putative disease resistance protein RGA3 [Oryza glaberrima]|uniref:putative disease resistance protein RGA3 n=1 Tax=Oryza glaberrima TaxID=4538 RepID=UPI00023E18FA|nr:putative disease resistance protein RGA3 [Oryza glaberrima]XP_052160205.1 putative disease resistance protein RGA3 [Oryza glaberrima]XP_052160206.1 putative disease resistance protein RGA3 [Oryza glaberrima]XP_052160207.1 putative disease resistance protein RGA3 [Oryza glaberrima]XP_052160208.1 putative disease resistance protein RGA3 [Oryza glaberrima]XP_052160209.1 putative disease resistance protein RGA3 [Oryza glaberrima]XP_052160210.1 putative disease resistance protein RGA3 [Oryza gl